GRNALQVTAISRHTPPPIKSHGNALINEAPRATVAPKAPPRKAMASTAESHPVRATDATRAAVHVVAPRPGVAWSDGRTSAARRSATAGPGASGPRTPTSRAVVHACTVTNCMRTDLPRGGVTPHG